MKPIQRHIQKKKKQDCQKEVVEIWNSIKNEANLQVQVDFLLKKWNSVSLMKIRALLNLWSKQNAPPQKKKSDTNSFNDLPSNNNTVEPLPIEFAPNSEQFTEPGIEYEDIYVASTSTKAIKTSIASVKPKPAQEELKIQISIIDGNFVGLYNRKSNGFLTEEQEEQESELKEKKVKKKELETLLKRKIDSQERSKKSQDSKKIKMAKLCETHPEIQNLLKIRNKPGKP